MGSFQSILNYSNNNAANNSEAQTAGTLLATIGYSFVGFAVQTIAFLLLRDTLTRIYRPKTYLVPERQRIPPPPSGLVAWLYPVFKTSNMTLIQKCGLDAYFFLRYLRMLLKIFIPAGCIIVPILLPINAVGRNDKTQLNLLNITNVGPYHTNFYWAHLIIAILFIIWTSYVMYKELRGYVRVRQAYLTSPQHRIRASATTVLVTGIPKRWLTLEALDGLYDVFPGGIRNIWINRNYDELSTKVQKRDKLSRQLESAEVNILKLCQKKNLKKMKAAGKSKKEISREMTPIHSSEQSSAKEQQGNSNISQERLVKHSMEEHADTSVWRDIGRTEAPEHISSSKLIEGITFWKSKKPVKEEIDYTDPYNSDYDQTEDQESLWRQYITPKERETMRLPLVNQDWFPTIPLMGKKVDRIYHLRTEVARLNLEIESDQKHPENFPLMNSAFIQFNHQVAAHMACQSVSHHVPLQMTPRLVEISPDDVIWDNLSINWWEKYIRTILVLAFNAALIIFYAIPVAFSAALNNLATIGQTFPPFDFLKNLTGVAKSLIQGLGPPLLLTLILLVIPILFRVLVGFQGVPTGNARELGLQNWYFVFLFIQVFLVATLTSGLLQFFQDLAKDPGSIASSISSSLPQAANYFLSYITVQAISNSASALLQLVTLALWFLLDPLLDSTPRDKWKRQTTLANVEWGSFFPPFTNFAVIGIIYSVIAPLIIPFVILIFVFYWVIYRYNVLYVYDFKNDTGGLLFPVAINQLFVGLYFLSLCLIGLFFTARDQYNNAAAVPQAVIMIVVLALTIVYQWQLNNTFDPLLRYMPITLEDDAVIRDEEFARAQASRFGLEDSDNRDAQNSTDIQDQLRKREEAEEQADKAAEAMKHDESEADGGSGGPSAAGATKNSWYSDPTKPRGNDRWRRVGGIAFKPIEGALDFTGRTGAKVEENLKIINEKIGLRTANEKLGQGLQTVNEKIGLKTANEQLNSRIAGINDQGINDEEAQTTAGDLLFSGLADDLEDLTPQERDVLVRYAFQHSALRARRPIVWIPEDDLGVSADEIKRAKKYSNFLPMSSAGARLNAKGKVVFDKSPPDFSNIDLISL